MTPARDGAHWVADDGALDEVVAAARAGARYALDTEFHRERTYFPRLALVQIAWDDQIALIDPLGVDIHRLAPLLESDSLCVVHAAQQDLDVLNHAVGAIPRQMFDTQLAASFVGYSTPSLVMLVNGELGATPAKGDRLTDWLRRPLTDDQLRYAAADVEYLFELHDRLGAQLDHLGRRSWAAEACEELRTRPLGGVAPEDAWLRLKDARSLRPRGRAIAQAVAAWREREARRTDSPVRQVLPDLAILGIAQRQPRSLDELGQARGVDDRLRRGRIAEEVFAAVKAAADADPPAYVSNGEELDRNLRPAVTLISAWVSQLAKNSKVDTTLLATRSDLVALLANDEQARLRHGWRAELLGNDVQRLLDGTAGLTFTRSGGLRLVEAAPGADPAGGQPSTDD